MTISTEEAKRILLHALGGGTEDLYDEEGDVGLYIEGIARALKIVGFDLVDTLRKEIDPSTMEQKIVDWEASCGVKETPTARRGTLEQRRHQVLSKLRQHASFSLSDIRAALQPFLLYSDPNQIEIIEPDRSALRVSHTYSILSTWNLPANASIRIPIFVPDSPAVSPAGCQLAFTLSTFERSELTITLVSPSGKSISFSAQEMGHGTAMRIPFSLSSKALVGVPLFGRWRVQFDTKTHPCTVENIALFVEGLGRNYDAQGKDVGEGLGAALFYLVVVVDPNLLGSGFDLQGAELALQRMTPAHCASSLVSISEFNLLCPFPDLQTTLPEQSIPC